MEINKSMSTCTESIWKGLQQTIGTDIYSAISSKSFTNTSLCMCPYASESAFECADTFLSSKQVVRHNDLIHTQPEHHDDNSIDGAFTRNKHQIWSMKLSAWIESIENEASWWCSHARLRRWKRVAYLRTDMGWKLVTLQELVKYRSLQYCSWL